MRVILLILALSVAGPSVAATTCLFTQECLEGEACAETSYRVELVAGDGQVIQLISDAETLEGRMIASDDNLHYVFEAPTAAHLLSEAPSGAARYTIHLDGPFTITYHGTCEGTP